MEDLNETPVGQGALDGDIDVLDQSDSLKRRPRHALIVIGGEMPGDWLGEVLPQRRK